MHEWVALSLCCKLYDMWSDKIIFCFFVSNCVTAVYFFGLFLNTRLQLGNRDSRIENKEFVSHVVKRCSTLFCFIMISLFYTNLSEFLVRFKSTFFLMCFGDIGCRDVCLLSTIMEVDGTQLVVLKAPENSFEPFNNNVSSQQSNLVAQDNPQTLVCTGSVRNYTC